MPVCCLTPCGARPSARTACSSAPHPLHDLGVAVGVLEDDRAVLQGFEAVHGGFVLDEVREAVGLSRELVVLLHDGDALQRSIRGERRPELILRGGPREPGLAFRILSLSNSKFPVCDFEVILI